MKQNQNSRRSGEIAREKLGYILLFEVADPDLALVTNGYHQYRAQLIASEQGLDAGAVRAETAWWLVPTYVLREICAIAHEWL